MKKGFTLIELIVVLAILGLILAIAVPNYMGIRQNATTSADIRTAELLAKHMKVAFSDGTLYVGSHNNKPSILGKRPKFDSDGAIIGFYENDQRFVGTGGWFDRVMVPIYYSDPLEPQDPDSGNYVKTEDRNRFMFEIDEDNSKIKIYIGDTKSSTLPKTVLTEFAYK